MLYVVCVWCVCVLCARAHIYVHAKLKKLTYINNICIPINIDYLVCNICLSDKNDHNIYIYILCTQKHQHTLKKNSLIIEFPGYSKQYCVQTFYGTVSSLNDMLLSNEYQNYNNRQELNTVLMDCRNTH